MLGGGLLTLVLRLLTSVLYGSTDLTGFGLSVASVAFGAYLVAGYHPAD